jgi:hypothetical protein
MTSSSFVGKKDMFQNYFNVFFLQKSMSVYIPTCFYQKFERLLWSKLLVYATLTSVIKACISVHGMEWRRLRWPNIPTHSRNQWTGISHKTEHILHVVELGHKAHLAFWGGLWSPRVRHHTNQAPRGRMGSVALTTRHPYICKSWQ